MLIPKIAVTKKFRKNIDIFIAFRTTFVESKSTYYKQVSKEVKIKRSDTAISSTTGPALTTEEVKIYSLYYCHNFFLQGLNISLFSQRHQMFTKDVELLKDVLLRLVDA